MIIIVIVAGQRHGAAEGVGVHRCIAASEVRLEITYAAVALEDGAQRFELMPHCILESILELIDHVIVRHHLRPEYPRNDYVFERWPDFPVI